MRKKLIAAVALSSWLILISLFMLFAERFDLLLFFILGFIGFLVIVELMEPKYVKPKYIQHLKVLLVVGIMVCGAIVAQKVLDMLGLEIVIG
jgi:hypothetical protein